MKLRTAFATIATVLSIGLTGSVWAACSGPVGQAGRIIYAGNVNMMVYCDGTNWVSMAGGVSQTINTTGGGGATPAGSSADVQFNSGGALGADTGLFTYASGLLKAPSISATNVYANSVSGTTGTFGGIGTGSVNASGQVSAASVVATQVSATNVSVTTQDFAVVTVATAIGAGGNSILSGTASVSTSSANGGTVKIGTGSGLVMTVSGANVGIGTSVPTDALTIVRPSGNNTGIQFTQSSVYTWWMGMLASGAYWQLIPGGSAGTPAITVTNGGNVGIGTTSPGQKLSVVGTSLFTGAFQVIGTVGLSGIANSAGDSYLCWNSSSGSLSWSVTSCNPSDTRLKENIRPLQNALDKITRLKGVTFTWRDSHRAPGEQIGLIAQNVEKVFPSVVANNKDGFKSVSYEKLVSPLIEAVKELKTDNDNLRAEFEAYKRDHP